MSTLIKVSILGDFIDLILNTSYAHWGKLKQQSSTPTDI